MTVFEDPFGLSDVPVGKTAIVSVGEVNVSHALRGIRWVTQVNAVPEAVLEIDITDPVVPEIDYTRTVTIGLRDGDMTGVRAFTGSVISATKCGDQLKITSSGAPELDETRIRACSARRVGASELFHSVARLAGFPDDKINAPGLDQLPVEVFEVCTPVTGFPSGASGTIGHVTLTPSSGEVSEAVHEATTDDLAARFLDAGHCVVNYITAERMVDAEEAGVGQIDSALAWLIVRSRFATARLPGPHIPDWNREQLHWTPKRGSLVMVRGMTSGRTWIRDPRIESTGVQLSFRENNRELQRPRFVPGNIPRSEHEAILACSRAATVDDRVNKLTEIWTSLEFYSAGIKVPKMFKRSDLDRLRDAIPENLSSEQKRRVWDVVQQMVNRPSLFMKLRRRVMMDGVPLSSEDWALLRELRDARNEFVHGGSTRLPTDEQLVQGVALVARMLIYAHDQTQRPQHPAPDTGAGGA